MRYGNYKVPKEIATCPECHSELGMEVYETDTETGEPTDDGVLVYCTFEIGNHETSLRYHRHWYSDWAHIEDKVTKWAQEHHAEIA